MIIMEQTDLDKAKVTGSFSVTSGSNGPAVCHGISGYIARVANESGELIINTVTGKVKVLNTKGTVVRELKMTDI